MTALLQPSFGKGEIAPDLYGRTDTAAYKVALKTALNFNIVQYGGAENRAGLQFIGPVKTHSTAVRLIPFQFKATDAYVIEMGNLYMRFIRNDAYVNEADVVISGITAADPGVVTATSHGYSDGDQVLISGVVGMTEVNSRWFKVANKTTHTFELTTQEIGTNVDTSGYTAYGSAGVSAKVYELATPYVEADLFQVNHVQSADVMTMVHPSYTIRELTRSDHNAWTITEPSFRPDQDHPIGLTLSATTSGSEAEIYQVTAINADTGEESIPALNSTDITCQSATAANPVVVTATGHSLLDGDEIEIRAFVEMTEINHRRFTVANKATNTFELFEEDGSSYAAETTGGTANLTFVSISNGASSTDNALAWTAITGADRYSVYRYDNGIYGWIGDTTDVSFQDFNLATDLDVTPPKARNPFRGTGNYPGAVSYYEQRRVFGGSDNKPDTTYYSGTGNQNNFSVHSPFQASDAITATLNSLEVNTIRHFVPVNDMLILTAGSEWKINYSSDTGLAANTLKQKPQSAWGSSYIRPIPIGNTTLYVSRNRAAVRQLQYDLTRDGYLAEEVSLFSHHMFDNYKIVDWAHMKTNSTTAVVREDGVALAMTYQPEQQVIAWTRWETNGKFESVTSIYPDSTSIEDTTYFVIKRNINGNVVRFVEKYHTRRFTDVRDCFFLDSGLSLDHPIAVSGVTSANPVVVTTSVAHGLSDGDVISLSDIEWVPNVDVYDGKTQPDQLNYSQFTVANKTSTTFELTGIDGTSYNAYVEGGNVRCAVSTVGGLHHLEGETLVGLADGNYISGMTVVDGTVTLARAASRIHLGMPYVCDFESLDLEIPTQGTIIDRKKKVSQATFYLKDSRGLFYGHTLTQMDELKQRQDEKLSAPTDLFTGPKTVHFPPAWDEVGSVVARQKYPLPVTILSVTPDTEIGD